MQPRVRRKVFDAKKYMFSIIVINFLKVSGQFKKYINKSLVISKKNIKVYSE
jgi:hypothetical protein